MSPFWQHIVEVAAALLLVAGLVVLFNWLRWSKYRCALGATAILVPGVAGFFTIALFLAHEDDSFRWWVNADGTRAFVSGTVIALLLWLLFASSAHDVADAATAHQAEYARLREVLGSLERRIQHAASNAQGAPDRQAARAEAKEHLDAARSELGAGDRPSTKWTTGAGYVEVLMRLHRADEALIRFDYAPAVRAGGLYDESRLDGSKIAQGKQFERIKDAVTKLETRPWDAFARAELSQVRRTIDEFRDSRRSGLVRQKTIATATAILMAVNAYSLLGIALIVGAAPGQILAAAVFYLVGATVGVFAQLQALSSSVVLTEDYGLRQARLYQTPLFSGLAAVGGVVVTAMLLAVTPAPVDTTSDKRKPAEGPPSLHRIFDLPRYPLNVLIAAVFGLTPSLLITRLHAAGEQYKADLKSTEAGEHAATS